LKKNKIFYWSPSLVNIATNEAVINSAYSLKRYDETHDTSIINFFGEFKRYKENIDQKNIKLINCYNQNIFKYFPRHGKIYSRISFMIIFILSFFPLKKLLKKQEPDFLIVQLITSLPMLLLIIYNFKTKFVLRISGLPKLNFFRKLLWRIALKKFYLVTCPTKSTLEHIKSLNLINPNKIKLLYDPVISVKQIRQKLNKKNKFKFNNYFLAAGRLTKQKNFLFLIKAFQKILTKHPQLNLIIAGEGEERVVMEKYIYQNDLTKKIHLVGYIENIFPLIRDARAFILSSLWEDPGFVIIEAAFCRTPILSSNCFTGPREIIKDNFNGFLFESDDIASFIEKFEKLIIVKNNHEILLNNIKNIKKFTLFNHYKEFKELIKIN